MVVCFLVGPFSGWATDTAVRWIEIFPRGALPVEKVVLRRGHVVPGLGDENHTYCNVAETRIKPFNFRRA